MPANNIYQSNTDHVLDNILLDMDMSLWEEMLQSIAQVLESPAIGIILTSEVGFQNIAMSAAPGTGANPGKIIPKEVNLYCKQVLESKSQLYIKNATNIERWQDNPELTQMGYVSYVGLPILRSNGSVFATLCIRHQRNQLPASSTKHTGVGSYTHRKRASYRRASEKAALHFFT